MVSRSLIDKLHKKYILPDLELLTKAKETYEQKGLELPIDLAIHHTMLTTTKNFYDTLKRVRKSNAVIDKKEPSIETYKQDTAYKLDVEYIHNQIIKTLSEYKIKIKE